MNVSPFSKFVPGPGTYAQEKDSLLKTDPQWRFGTGTRPALLEKTGTKELGPGAYNIPSRAVEGRQ